MSCVPPKIYAKRFYNFMNDTVFPIEGEGEDEEDEDDDDEEDDDYNSEESSGE